jgi:hypothetical protein
MESRSGFLGALTFRGLPVLGLLACPVLPSLLALRCLVGGVLVVLDLTEALGGAGEEAARSPGGGWFGAAETARMPGSGGGDRRCAAAGSAVC